MVDIIIRAKNGHELTAACIASIRDNTPLHQFRIILVDDGSGEPYRPTAVDFLLRANQSRGAVSATNIGLGLALQLDGDYVLVLDNDTEVPSGDTTWLERFVRELEQTHRTAAVGATTNNVKAVQHILLAPQTYTADWHDEKDSRGGLKDNPQMPEFVSFAVLLRKDAIKQVGFWDARYNPGNFEDTDYAVQLRIAGWEVRVARSVYIHHHCHQTFGNDLERLLQENGTKFVQKWGPGQLWDLQLIDDRSMGQIVAARARG